MESVCTDGREHAICRHGVKVVCHEIIELRFHLHLQLMLSTHLSLH